MPLQRRKRVVVDGDAGGTQVVGDFALLIDGEQHVGLDADDQRAAHAELRECRGERSAAVIGEVELVHRPRQVEVSVRVEGVGEPQRLVLEVGLDLELGPEVPGEAGRLRHTPATEALVPLLRRSVRDRAKLAREAQAEARATPGLVVAAAPGGVAAHHLTLQRTQGDRERRRAGRARDRDEAVDRPREQRTVREHHHAAERRANEGRHAFDAERAECRVAGGRDVLDGDLGESDAVRATGTRVDRSRSRGSERTAERVHADDVEAPRVERPTFADHGLPPARTRIGRRGGGVRRRRQPCENQDRVVARRVRLAPGLVRDDRLLDHAAPVEPQRLRQPRQPASGQVVRGGRGRAGECHGHAGSLCPPPGRTSARG